MLNIPIMELEVVRVFYNARVSLESLYGKIFYPEYRKPIMTFFKIVKLAFTILASFKFFSLFNTYYTSL